MLYERTALSKKPDALIRQELKALRAEDRMSPNLFFRDPHILDFLGLKDHPPLPAAGFASLEEARA
jgi:predicted nuclease of restriction endonuclease-like (RecB) superfamily